MKQISMRQGELKEALNTVRRAAGGRTTLPVLGNVLLVSEGSMEITATDLEVWIRARAFASGDHGWRVTLPARLLAEVVAVLPDERLELAYDGDRQAVTVTCDRYVSTIKGISADEFPVVDDAGMERVLEVDADRLRQLIERVVYAASRDESRPILTGVRCRIGADGWLEMAAADGYQLARGSTAAKVRADFIDGVVEFIVPARALREAARLGPGAVSLAVDDLANPSKVMFGCGKVDVGSVLVAGRYPDAEEIIRQESPARVVVRTADMLRALRAGRLFAREAADYMVLEFDGDHVRLTGRSDEAGESRADVAATIEGEAPARIAFNGQYLAEAFGAAGSECAALDLAGAAEPGVVRVAPDDDGWLGVIMPMHMREG